MLSNERQLQFRQCNLSSSQVQRLPNDRQRSSINWQRLSKWVKMRVLGFFSFCLPKKKEKGPRKPPPDQSGRNIQQGFQKTPWLSSIAG
jgi:hypothetical protein